MPSEAELIEARKLRDAGWQLVLQDWRKEATDAAVRQDFLAAAGEANDLAAAYEKIVRRADDLSDRLRREANRVANRATLQAQQFSLQQQTAELGRQQVLASDELQKIVAQWRRTWHPAGIDPLPPREMQAWIQRQQGLVQQAQTVRQRTASLEHLEEQIAAHCRQLQSCLDGVATLFGQGAGSADRCDQAAESSTTPPRECARQPTLDNLLALGDSILEQIKETTESRRQLEREKNRLAKAVAQAEAKAVQAEADLTQWRALWTAAIQPLGLPGDSSPVAVNEVVAQTAELLATTEGSRRLSERIDGIGATRSASARMSSSCCKPSIRIFLRPAIALKSAWTNYLAVCAGR